VVFVLNGIVVRYFSDKNKAEWIPSIAAWLGMSFSLLCLCLTPVDIYATGLTQTLEQSKSPIFANIKLLYFGTLCLLVLMSPFGEGMGKVQERRKR
jgi:hypothetical protein